MIIKRTIGLFTAEEEVQEMYKRLEGKDVLTLATEMNLLRIDLENLGEVKTSVQKRYDALRLNLVPSAMDDNSISNITIEGIGRVGLTSDLYASIIKEKKNDAYQWLRDNNHGDMIQETVNSGTLKAAFKQIIKKGKEVIPTTLFKVTPFSRASITKVTKS